MCALEPDLLFGLAQRRLGERRILNVLAPAGKGDLSGVSSQVGSAPSQDDVRLVPRGGHEQRHEHCRRDLVGSACEGPLRRPGERAQCAPGT